MFAPLLRRFVIFGGFACAVAVVFAAAELAMRLLTHARGACHPICITEYDSTLGWTNAPGAAGRHTHAALDIDVVYRIDARGVRRGTIADRADPAARRLVVLGDSNGFGWGIDDADHFAARLARLTGFEVLNLAVSGYGTDQSLLRFLAEGIPFRPHAVVLQLTPNDFDDIQQSMIGGRAKPYFTLEASGLELHNVPVAVLSDDAERLAGGPWLPIPVRAWLARHSYLYAWLNDRRESVRSSSGRTPRFSAGSRALFRALVARIREAAAAAGTTVVLVHGSSEIRELHADVVPSGVPVCDLSGQFRTRGPALFADNLHWNARGHEIVADALAMWLTGAEFPAESPVCEP